MAAAAPLAALMKQTDCFDGKKVALVVSRANSSSRLLASIIMSSIVRNGRIITLRISMSDNSGALANGATHIDETGGNMFEIVHKRLFYDVPVNQPKRILWSKPMIKAMFGTLLHACPLQTSRADNFLPPLTANAQ